MNINFPKATFDGPQFDTQNVGHSKGISSAQGTGQSDSPSIQGSEEVSLSKISVTALKAQLAGLPAIRQGRVQALRKAIQNGSYEVNSKLLADSIHADLFGPVNSGS